MYALSLNWNFIFKIIMLVLIVSGVVYILYDQSKDKNIVTTDEMKAYAIEYFSMYKNLVEENMYLFIGEDNEDIMPESMWNKIRISPIFIKGIISTHHGAALWYDYSGEYTGNIYTDTDKRIEKWLWPNIVDDTSIYRPIRILGGVYEMDNKLIIENNMLHLAKDTIMISKKEYKYAFEFIGQSTILIEGTLILENSLIVKGNNNKIYWSRPQADLDALFQFLYDSKKILENNKIKELETKYKPPFILDVMQYCIKTKYYEQNPHLFYEHYYELKQVGFDNDIIMADIWSEYKEMQLYIKPTFIDSILNNYYFRSLYDNLTPIILGIVIGLLASKNKYIRKLVHYQ